METIIDRLAKLVEMNRKTINGFARLVGLDSGEFSKMMKGNRKITDRTLKKVSDACGVRFEWLLTGEGEMREAAAVGGPGATPRPEQGEGGKTEVSNNDLIEMLKARDQQIERLLTIIERMQ